MNIVAFVFVVFLNAYFVRGRFIHQKSCIHSMRMIEWVYKSVRARAYMYIFSRVYERDERRKKNHMQTDSNRNFTIVNNFFTQKHKIKIKLNYTFPLPWILFVVCSFVRNSEIPYHFLMLINTVCSLCNIENRFYFNAHMRNRQTINIFWLLFFQSFSFCNFDFVSFSFFSSSFNNAT